MCAIVQVVIQTNKIEIEVFNLMLLEIKLNQVLVISLLEISQRVVWVKKMEYKHKLMLLWIKSEAENSNKYYFCLWPMLQQ